MTLCMILHVFGTFHAQIYIYMRIITALTIIIPRALWSPENENEGPSFVPALKTVSFSSIPMKTFRANKYASGYLIWKTIVF